MAQDITLLNAQYSAVPAVTLPKTGGGTATFTDVTDTTATAEDVATGKYFYTAGGTRTAGTNTGGGGGATNIVQGTFTTGSTRAGTGTFTIPYTGSGYPIALTVFVKGGAYNNTSSGNTTWYNSTNRYDAGWVSITKARTTTAPGYASSGADNQGNVAVIYKNNASTATTYSRTSSMTAYTFNSSTSNANTGVNCVRFKGNGTTVSYYVGNLTSSTIGLAPSTEFEYIAIYSE